VGLVSSNRSEMKSKRRGKVRAALAARDGHKCFYCGQSFTELRKATLDHYIPYRLWRGWRQENLVLACETCNSAKGDALPWPLVWLLLAHHQAPVLAA
jgi:5-methylcytosine-specific restriction endonuclease McrA